LQAFLRDVAYVAAGGALGSGLRYAVGVWSSQRFSHDFPWHTFAVNVTGSFLLGALLSYSVDRSGWGHWQLFAGVGLLGGFTTFSTFSYETLRLMQGGMTGAAVANAAGSLTVGLIAAGLGVLIGRSL
jgi:CrcB protein